jgi:HAD superfamily hydrolase (TIGR01509 family)
VADAVVFDFNGVLVDDEHLHLAAFNEALAPLGVVMTPEAYAERYLGFDDRGAFVAVLGDHGRSAPVAQIAELIASKAAVYARRARDELRIFPGAADLVVRAGAVAPVAIVSGALRIEINGALTVMGVAHVPRVIVAADDVTACKPDPEGYRLACDQLARTAGASRLRLDRVIAIEDSVAGIEAARAAGIAVVAVAHTYDRETLARAGARAVFDTIADVSPERLDALLDACA